MPHAKRLIQIEDRATSELAEIAAGRAGRLRVAYLLHGDVVLQGKIVAQFRRCYPDVEVGTSAGHSRTNLDILSNGDVDAAFIELPAEIPDGIALQSIGRARQLMLALPLDHQLADLEQVPVEALRGVPLVLRPASENPAMSAALILWLTRLTSGGLNVVAEEPTDQAVEAVATPTSKAAIVSWSRASTSVAGVAFKPLTPAPLVEFSFANRSDDPMPALKNLLRVLGEFATSTLGEDVEGELLRAGMQSAQPKGGMGWT